MINKPAIVCITFLIMLVLIPSIAASSFTQGSTDLRNGTVINTAGTITYQKGTRADSQINFSGFNGEYFYWVHDNALVYSEAIAADSYMLNTTTACTVWAVIDNGTAVILRTHTAAPSDPMSLSSFGGFWYNAWGAAAYLFLMLIPVALWQTTGSSSSFAIGMLILAAPGAIVLPDAIKPIVLIPIALSIAVMMYKLFGPKGD